MGLFSELGKKYAKVAKPIVDKTPGFKWVGQEATNFWTGFRMSKPAAAIGISALALYSAGSGVKAAVDYKQQARTANSQNVGPMPAMQYIDPNLATSARTNLGATGDLVFGLYNSRKGR